jgi:hypothetical protein
VIEPLEPESAAAEWRFVARMTAIASTYGQAWRKRAGFGIADRHAASARNSLISMPEVTREPLVRRQAADPLLALAAS